MHTHPYDEHTYLNPTYPYEHLQKTVSAHLEIDEDTTGVSLSTETSHNTESITPLNPRINPEKYKYSP